MTKKFFKEKKKEKFIYKKHKNNKFKTEKKTKEKQIKKNNKERIEEKMNVNLDDSKFRLINEQLYKSTSEEALNYFKENKEDFEIYHKGFSTQAKKWPINPNDLILKTLLLPKYKNMIITDIGCGEAKIANKLKPLGYTVYSFDLVSLNENVQIADMKNLPLNNNFCDVAIFCLSLMNKNFIPFIIESNRILKIGGKLIVAEISSRIVDLNKFINIFLKYGFSIIKQKNFNNFFEIIVFKKIKYKSISKEDNNLDNTYNILKPCLYKKR